MTKRSIGLRDQAGSDSRGQLGPPDRLKRPVLFAAHQSREAPPSSGMIGEHGSQNAINPNTEARSSLMGHRSGRVWMSKANRRRVLQSLAVRDCTRPCRSAKPDC